MRFPIPTDALDDRLATVGTAGAGKTYACMTAMELLMTQERRYIAIDALGVMWGLRLMLDGKTPSRFNVVIFGGKHGDLPITEHAGALIGETVATMRESCIIDLSQLSTKAAERRFMLAFLTALYRHTVKSLVHLVIDEADMWAPQRLLDKEGDAAKLLGMMETIVRRGRVKGFIPWLITQRPAVLSKDVLSQADGIVALKLTSKQDRDAIGGWVEATADRTVWKGIDASLPTMQRGHGVIWIPARGILDADALFPEKTTYDSSRAPKRGEKITERELKPLDVGALRDKLATIEAETKANDPRALKAKVTELTRELDKVRQSGAASIPVAKGEAAALRDRERAFAAGKAEGWSEAWPQGWMQGWAVGAKDQRTLITKMITNVSAPPVPDKSPPAPRGPKAQGQTQSTGFQASPSQVNRVPVSRPAPVRRDGVKPNGALPPGERAVLIAAAQFDGIEREQLTVLTGYKRSSRDAYIQRLREKGYIALDGSTIRLTDEGGNALPADYEPLPTGAELADYWLRRLPEGERKVLEVLIEAYPNAVARADIDDATGYKRSSRDAYLQRMKAKRLWEPAGDGVRAAEALF